MGYKQPNNPMKMMKSALKMYKADKKAGMHRDSAMYMNSPMYKGHSPMEMGHESPAEMGHSPMEMGHDSPAKNASQYGIQGVDELKYMPIVDDMHRKGDSPAKNMDHSKMDKKQRFDHMMVHHPAKKPPPKGKLNSKKNKSLPKRDKEGFLRFADHPKFRPNLTPKEVTKT